jgi:hypothetical protein
MPIDDTPKTVDNCVWLIDNLVHKPHLVCHDARQTPLVL